MAVATHKPIFDLSRHEKKGLFFGAKRNVKRKLTFMMILWKVLNKLIFGFILLKITVLLHTGIYGYQQKLASFQNPAGAEKVMLQLMALDPLSRNTYTLIRRVQGVNAGVTSPQSGKSFRRLRVDTKA